MTACTGLQLAAYRETVSAAHRRRVRGLVLTRLWAASASSVRAVPLPLVTNLDGISSESQAPAELRESDIDSGLPDSPEKHGFLP